MSVPDFQTVMLPLLESLRDGQERTMRELVEVVARRFELTDEQLNERLPSGQQTVFNNRIGWAKTYLKNAGLIENPSRGRVNISQTGLQVLNQKPARIDVKFLKQFPVFLKYYTQIPDDEGEQEEVVVESGRTPLELLEASFNTLRNETATSLLERLRACSPPFFETVVVRLLVAMGYGGVTGEAWVTGKSGDGGIDGIIKEDKLGLDVVCIQAKRWGDSVGRPVIQQFVGSMDYIRAKKGVILTTSQFSKDAHDFVDRIEGKKVVLIDGPKLAELMLDHNVGVKLVKQYDLKELSNDFFDEDEG